MSRNMTFFTELGAILGNNKTQKSERHEFQDGEQATGCACIGWKRTRQVGRKSTFNISHHRGVSCIKLNTIRVKGVSLNVTYLMIILHRCYTGLVGHVSLCTRGGQNSSMECASHSVFTRAPGSELRLPGLHSAYPLNQEVAPEMFN